MITEEEANQYIYDNPPVVSDVYRLARPGLSLYVAWFTTHARRHRGMWVAVKTGELICESKTSRGLKNKLTRRGHSYDDTSIFISRVP